MERLELYDLDKFVTNYQLSPPLPPPPVQMIQAPIPPSEFAKSPLKFEVVKIGVPCASPLLKDPVLFKLIYDGVKIKWVPTDGDIPASMLIITTSDGQTFLVDMLQWSSVYRYGPSG